MLDGSFQTEAIGKERAALKRKKKDLTRRQQNILRELNYRSWGDGSRWDLLNELNCVNWELPLVEHQLAVASHEAGSHFEEQNVPRGGQ